MCERELGARGVIEPGGEGGDGSLGDVRQDETLNRGERVDASAEICIGESGACLLPTENLEMEKTRAES